MSAVVQVALPDGTRREVELPAGSAAALYHEIAMLADAEQVGEDVPLARAGALREAYHEARTLRDLLVLATGPGSVVVVGGDAASVVRALRDLRAGYLRVADGLRGRAREHAEARAAGVTLLCSLAARADPLAAEQPDLRDGGGAARLYAALCHGAARALAAVGPQAIPLVASLTNDLSILAGVDDTRQQCGEPSRIVLAR